MLTFIKLFNKKYSINKSKNTTMQYKVKFQDTFSGATSYREVKLTTSQYLRAKDQLKNKEIVVSKLINHCHVTLIITAIYPICGLTTSGHHKYFDLNIHQKINERQNRNSLNINNLFSTVITQNNYGEKYPKINNGLYHHSGKSHNKYPLKDYSSKAIERLNNANILLSNIKKNIL